jgi:hypothetical protein
MRKLMVGVVCAAAMAVPSVAPAQQQGWSYAYTEGVATATQRDDRGRITATLTCRPPTGDIIVTDYTLARNARGARTAAVQPNDRLSVTVNGETHTYLEGGPARMREVAYGCWGS